MQTSGKLGRKITAVARGYSGSVRRRKVAVGIAAGLLLAGVLALVWVIRGDDGARGVTSVQKDFVRLEQDGVSVSGPLVQTEYCGYVDCFEARFRKCASASSTARIGHNEKTAPVAVLYEITGPHGGGCGMVFRYTKHPNADWVGKDLVCEWDNSLPLQTAVDRAFADTGRYNCEGALVREINR